MGWEMEWSAATIWDATLVAGIVVVFLYALYTRAVGDSQPEVIETSIPDDHHESAI